MTRARFVLGDGSLRLRFDAIRQAVIVAPRDAPGLQTEIVAMRDKVRAAHPVHAVHVAHSDPLPGSAPFDVKHSPGGMVDVEFAVQYLVLSQAGAHPELIANVGNIALLERAQACGLLPDASGVWPHGLGHAAADAYRELRRVQHRARLNEEPTQVNAAVLQAERNAVLALWHLVFGAPAASA